MASGSDLRKGGAGQEEGGKEDGAAGVRSTREGGMASLGPLEGPIFWASSWAQAPAHLQALSACISGQLFWGLSVGSCSFYIITSRKEAA